MMPTEKQMQFIADIMEYTDAPRFKGKTKAEASEYIDRYKPLLRIEAEAELSEHISKYFESQQQTSIEEDSKIKLPEQYDKATKDFSKRLDEFCITTVDVYLEIIQNLIQDYTNNEKIHHNLILLEDALQKKKKQLMINGVYSEEWILC